MADIYTTVFSVSGESTSASFEYSQNAIALAKALAGAGYEPVVIDERRNTIWPVEDE